MSQLISLSVEKYGATTYSTPQTFALDPDHIKFVQAENTDVFNDRALVSYYDNQNKIIVPIITTDTVDEIQIAANAAATDPILYYVVVSHFDRKLLGKLVLLNTDDGIVSTLPPVSGVYEPKKAFYDLGERAHMKHAELDYCSYPLTVLSVNESDNSVTVGCCVDNFLTAGTSISVGGSPFTVASVSCTDDGGVIVVEESVALVVIGDAVELT